MSLPNCKVPCKNCPFRKDSLKGWLGENRMTSILSNDSFTCHKTGQDKNNSRLQCAGHMLIKGDQNSFVRLAASMNLETNLKGRELIFDTEKECIEHHKH